MKYWLMKSEPKEFSIDDLSKSKVEMWDGIRNYQVRNMMRDEMREGDMALFYHSNDGVNIGVAGVMEITKEAYTDPTQFDKKSAYSDPKSDPNNPRWLCVDVKFREKLPRVVTLQEIKADPLLSDTTLVQKGNRLSVMPIEKSHFEHIVNLVKKKTPGSAPSPVEEIAIVRPQRQVAAEKVAESTTTRARNSNGFVKLFVAKRLIEGSAAAIVGIFIPIFLYETSGGLFSIVALYYASLSLLYALLVVPGMSIVNRIGFSRSLVIGGVFNLLFFVTLFFLTPENIWYLFTPLAISTVGFWIFHWVPYNVDFTLFTTKEERGRQVSLSFAAVAFMGVIGPILAGFIISKTNYSTLFGIAVILLIASTIAYSLVPETSTRFEWGWKETWRKLFSKDVRGMVFGEFASGAETVVSVVVWPIFLFEILKGDVFEIGAVTTIVVGTTIIVELLLGRHIDKVAKAKEKVLKIGSAFYAAGWIFKIFVLSAAHVFFVGLYHNVAKIFTRTPFNTILYDMSAEQGKYVDEYTVLREIAVHTGRATSLLVILVLTMFIPIGWTFIIAAGASIALNFVYQARNVSWI